MYNQLNIFRPRWSVMALLCFAAPYCLAQSYWTGAGVTNNFHLTTNWSAGIPGVNDAAYFDLPGSYVVNVDMDTFVHTMRFEDGSPEFIGGNSIYVDDQADILPGTSVTFSNVSSIDFGVFLRVFNGVNVPGELIITNNVDAEAFSTVVEGRLLIRDATFISHAINTFPDDGNALIQIDENAVVNTVSGVGITEYFGGNGGDSLLIVDDAQLVAPSLLVDYAEVQLANSATIIADEINLYGYSQLSLTNGCCLIADSLNLSSIFYGDLITIDVYGSGNMLLAPVQNLPAGQFPSEINVNGELTATEFLLSEYDSLNLTDATLTMDTIETSGLIRFNSGVNLIAADVWLVNEDFYNTCRLEMTTPGLSSIDGQLRHQGEVISVVPGGNLRLLGEVDGDGPYSGGGKITFFDSLQPGDMDLPGYAIIGFENVVDFKATSSVRFDVDGILAGINHDRLEVAGELELNGQLDLHVNGHFLAGDTITLIDVDGNSSGNFLGYPEGSTFDPGIGIEMSISYVGGDGNDVILTALDGTFVVGDINLDGSVDLLDVAPLVDLISNSGFQVEADINRDGSVDLLDVDPFIQLLSAG